MLSISYFLFSVFSADTGGVAAGVCFTVSAPDWFSCFLLLPLFALICSRVAWVCKTPPIKILIWRHANNVINEYTFDISGLLKTILEVIPCRQSCVGVYGVRQGVWPCVAGEHVCLASTLYLGLGFECQGLQDRSFALFGCSAESSRFSAGHRHTVQYISRSGLTSRWTWWLSCTGYLYNSTHFSLKHHHPKHRGVKTAFYY